MTTEGRGKEERGPTADANRGEHDQHVVTGLVAPNTGPESWFYRLRRRPMTGRTYRVFRVGFAIYNVAWLYVASMVAVSHLPTWKKALLFVPLFVGGPTLRGFESYEKYGERWKRIRDAQVKHLAGESNDSPT